LLPIRTLTRIQNNRDRLNQSELRYRETDPKKNPNWANLDAQAEIVEDLRHREQNAKNNLKGVYEKAFGRGSLPMVPSYAFRDIDTNPAECHALILQFYQQVTGPQWKTLEPQFSIWANELYLATTTKHAMFEKEPALAFVSADDMDQVSPTNPQNTGKLQQQITNGYATMRISMGKLEEVIQGDKSGDTAFELDHVVDSTLAGIKDPQQRQKMAVWVADKRKQEQDQRLLGNFGSGALAIASLFPGGQAAWLLGGAATALFGATTLQEIRQTGIVLDGVQGQGPGNQRLTSAGVGQAQTAYYSNYVNVAFLLVEGGMTVKGVVGLLQERRALETLTKLTPVERGEFAKAAGLREAGNSAEAEKVFQQLKKEVDPKTYKELEKVWVQASGSRYVDVDASVTPKLIRQYEALSNLSEAEIGLIVKNTGIPRKLINRVQKHLFVTQHEVWTGNYETGVLNPKSQFGNFAPDQEIANSWLAAKNGVLQGKELKKFQRLIAHEYIEEGLMEAGLPYRSRYAWSYDTKYGWGFWAKPGRYGAHDLASNQRLSNPPFSHWESEMRKSSEGLTIQDDLMNLDQVIKEIKKREKLQ
jgi:hypothetical protein